MSHSFTSSRSFARALGRIGAALPSFDEAMRHAALHAFQGQTTPLNRLADAAKAGGHLKGEAWRLCLETLRPALVGYAVERTGPAWEAKEAKAGGKRCTPAEAEAKAAALAPLGDAIEAARLAKEAKAAEAKEAKAKAAKEAAAEEAAKAAEAKAKGLSYDAEAEALAAKVAAMASADLAAVAKAKGTAEAPALRLVPMLAGMPGAMAAIAEALALAGVLAQSLGAEAEAGRTAEALESFGIAKAKAAEEAEAGRASRAKAAEECKAAQAEAAALLAEALALAEEAAATRASAKAKAEEAGAAKAAALAEAAAPVVVKVTKAKAKAKEAGAPALV